MIRIVKLLRRKPPLSVLLVGILLLILPVFAYLQYQWLGKVSEGEREQMKANLERSATQFSDSFDREISRVYTAFQLEPRKSASTMREDYALLYNYWLETAPLPGLVSDVLIASFESNGSRLERLNPETRLFEVTAWPDDLSKFRDSFKVETRRTGTDTEVLVRGIPGAIEPAIPALFIPLHEREVLRPEPPSLLPPGTFLVVRLDLELIRTELLPSLIETHFTGSQSDYNVAIFGAPPAPGPLFSTPGWASSTGDVTKDFFTPRFAEIRLMRAPGVGAARGNIGIRRSGRAVAQSLQFRVLHDTSERTEAGVLMNSGAWKLVATHRAGSLDAAVGQIRRRNLAISGGILLLLGGSVAMMLFSSQRAQRLARQQIEFVSAVSHELRTPLAVICSAGENLADGVVRDAEQTRQYGTVVRNEGRRLAEMVEQILDFAGVESGRRNYNFRATEISDVVQAAVDACSGQIRETGFQIETHLDVNGAVVLADKPALARAVQNLLSNAMKYSGPSRWIAICAGSSSGRIWLTVEDKGAGIPSADLPHIFEPFYRGRDVVDAQIKGSGLGLSLVKHIVEAHRGSVTVTSNAGRGTIFQMVLPAGEALDRTAREQYSPG